MKDSPSKNSLLSKNKIVKYNFYQARKDCSVAEIQNKIRTN